MKLVKLMGDDATSSLVHLSDEQLLECHQNMVRVFAFRAEVVSHHVLDFTESNRAKPLVVIL